MFITFLARLLTTFITFLARLFIGFITFSARVGVFCCKICKLVLMYFFLRLNHCFLSILFYLCNRKSLGKVAGLSKKSIEKRAWFQEKSLEKRA